MGFPETGIGIYPGLGGTQRTSRRIGVGLTRFLVLTGQILGAQQAREIGLVDAVVARDELWDAFSRLAAQGPAGEERWGPARSLEAVLEGLPEAWATVARIFEETPLERLLEEGAAGSLGIPEGPFQKALGALRYKAPVALRLADRLVREGASLTLQEGLNRELAALEEIFRTSDAYEGLKALTERRRPGFKGE
jgi:enoyl-CoA hydratase/3-hydroxyacyl-CoA dehydrogenase